MKNKKAKKKELDKNSSLEAIEDQEIKEPPVAEMRVSASGMSFEIKELIQKNIKWSQVIYNQNKQIKHRLTLMTVASWVKLALIIIPIILGIIFLPALIQDVWGQYGELLKTSGSGGFDLNSILNALSPEQVKETTKLLGQ